MYMSDVCTHIVTWLSLNRLNPKIAQMFERFLIILITRRIIILHRKLQ